MLPNLHFLRSTPSATRTRRAISTIVCLLLAFVALWIYLSNVAATPHRIPLLVIRATYSAPWDLNPWCAENAEAFRKLDNRNLSFYDAGDVNLLGEGQWEQFDALSTSIIESHAGQPLLLYINLHGAVDEQGEPCLIPPAAMMDDSRTWIRVRELLTHVMETFPAERPFVIMFESSRQGGLQTLPIDNHKFTDALGKTLSELQNEHKIGNLFALASSQSLIGSVADSIGNGDVFSQAVAQALSGTADTSSGNSDNYVQFSELVSFVTKHVRDSARCLRGIDQNVWSWSTAESDSVALTWRIQRPISLTVSYAEPSAEQKAKAAVAWKELSELAKQQPWETAPALWAELESSVLCLEQAVFGGRSVRQRVPEFEQVVEQRLSALKTILENESVPLLDEQIATHAQKTWSEFATSPTLQDLVNSLAKADQANSSSLDCVPLLELLSRDPKNQCWQYSDLMHRFAQLQQQQWSCIRSCFDGLLVDNLSTTAGKELASSDTQIANDEWRKLLEAELKVSDLLLASSDRETLGKAIAEYQLTLQEWKAGVETEILERKVRQLALASLPQLGVCMLAASYGESTKFLHVEDQLNLATLALATSNSEEHEARARSSVSLTNLLASLGQEYDELIDNSLNAQPTPSSAHRLSQVLRFVPRIASESYEDLSWRIAARQMLAEWDKHLRSEPTTQVSLTDDANHPASEFVSFYVGKLAESSGLQGMPSGSIRDLMRSARQRSESMFSGSERSSSIAEILQHSEQERMLAGLVRVGDDTHVRLYASNLKKSRLLRLAETSLDEFWSVPGREDVPFFVTLSRRALETARGYGSSESDDARLPFLEQTLRNRESAVRQGVLTFARWMPDFDALLSDIQGVASWRATVDLKPSDGAEFLPSGIGSASIVSDVPIGRAAVAVGPDLQATTATIEVPAEELSDLESPPNDSDAETDLSRGSRAVLMFRGNEYTFPFSLQPISGSSTLASFSDSANASITVHDSLPGTRLLTFVLDCSASMYEEAEQERTKGDSTDRITKLDAAKQALLTILAKLRDQGEFVSVVLYGHRVAQGTAEQGVLLQNRYNAAFPFSPNLTPFEDVETILTPGRFGYAEYEMVQRRLEAVVPWGQSPMFLAIREALQQSEATNTSASHEVVVISDGRNYQFNPTPEASTTVEQVIALAQRDNTRLHVIGFGVPDSEVAESAKQFELLAKETNGSTEMQIAKASLLAAKLTSVLDPSEFTVTLSDGSLVRGQCDAPLAIPGVELQNEVVSIRYKNKSYFVPVSRGSAIDLHANAAGHLVSARYLSNHPEFANLVDARGNLTDKQLAIHDSKQTLDGMQWRFSIQSTKGLVCKRPQFAIVEVSPQGIDAGEDSSIRCVDLAWTSGTSVPVFEFTTANWPASATGARVQAWLLYSDDLEPVASVGVNALPSPWTPAPDVTVLHRLTPSSLDLILLGEANALNFIPQVVGSNTMRISRRRSFSQSASQHRFEFANSEQAGELRLESKQSGQLLKLFSIQQIQSHAECIKLPYAMEVSFRREMATLPVGNTTR